MHQQSTWKSWYPMHMHSMGDFVLSQAAVVYAPVRKANARPPPFAVPNVVFHIRAIPSKGLGMLASKPLTRGELFLVESPLFIHAANISPAGLLAFYHALPHAAKQAVMNMANSNLGTDLEQTDLESITRQLLDILDTNCFDISPTTDQEILGIFPLACRINHSCLPNATRHFFVSHSPRLEFRAVRDIGVGEEITISYIQPFQPWRERQSFLRRHWRFRCNCEACSLHGLALLQSDRRRAALSDILDTDLTPIDAVETMERALRLLDEEQYFSGRFQFFARMLKVLGCSADVELVQYWIQRAKEAHVAERGSNVDHLLLRPT